MQGKEPRKTHDGQLGAMLISAWPFSAGTQSPDRISAGVHP